MKQREDDRKQREYDERVINMDLSGLSEDQKLFYNTCRREIIARRCGSSN